MDTLKADVLHALESGWGSYVEKIQQLTPQEQQKFIAQQGYKRLADLLGHVIAWWEVGFPAVKHLLEDPQWQSPNYEVDQFNAAAVQRFADWDDARVIELFERRRREWIELVGQIPESAWQIPGLRERIEIEIIGHFKEHQIA